MKRSVAAAAALVVVLLLRLVLRQGQGAAGGRAEVAGGKVNAGGRLAQVRPSLGSEVPPTIGDRQGESAGRGPPDNPRAPAPPSTDGGPRSAGWREHGGEGRRRKFDFDFREREEEPRNGRRHRPTSDSFEEDKDGLPEWCLEDEEEEEERMGTFDSSGAFMSLKVSSCPSWL